MKNLVDSLEIAADTEVTLGPFLVEAEAVTVSLDVETLVGAEVVLQLYGYDPIADDTFLILDHTEDAEETTILYAGRKMANSATAANLQLPSRLVLVISGESTVSVNAEGLRPNDLAASVEAVEAGNNTVVLLHCEGDDGVAATTDEMGNTVAFSGDATIDNAQKKFGDESILMPTFGDVVYTSALDPTIAEGDWTLEAFVRFGVGGGQPVLRLSDNMTAKTATLMLDAGGTLSVEISDDGAGMVVSEFEAVVIAEDTWYHIAMVKDGGDYYAFLDGSIVVNVTGVGNIADNLTEVHVFNFAGASVWFDEVRYSRIARYDTGGFTPPAAPFEVD